MVYNREDTINLILLFAKYCKYNGLYTEFQMMIKTIGKYYYIHENFNTTNNVFDTVVNYCHHHIKLNIEYYRNTQLSEVLKKCNPIITLFKVFNLLNNNQNKGFNCSTYDDVITFINNTSKYNL